MSRRHVLLIEQNAVSRQLVALCLEPLDLDFHGCASIAAGHCWMGVHGAPDLLLTGLKFSGESGMAFIAALRRGSAWQHSLPVMVIASDVSPQQRLELHQQQVLCVLVKPFALDLLRDTVSSVLDFPPHVAQLEAVRTRFNGDEKMYGVFVAGCIDYFPADAQATSNACALSDWATVQRVAHSLKSVLALLREDVASELARRMEQACAEGRTAAAVALWAILRPWLLWFAGRAPSQLTWSQAPSLYIPGS